MSKIPEEIAELKPMALNNVPNPATCKYHQQKFQEGSGMFGPNQFARSLLDFWSSIPRNIRDFWSVFKEVPKNFKILLIPKNFCHNP